MNTTLIIIALFTAVATLLGGYFALRFRDKSHLIVGVSAGAVIGVAFFDLFPESIQLSGLENIEYVTVLMAVGFIVYLIIERAFKKHNEHQMDRSFANLISVQKGNLQAGSFSLHSFLDGIGIGLAFQVSFSIGVIIAIAVLAHDFSDGVNTVSVIMKNSGSRKLALKWLVVDSLAPALGILATLFFSVSSNVLGLILAFFCGSFLYIGASDLIPESYHDHPTKWTTIATISGIIFIYIISRIII